MQKQLKELKELFEGKEFVYREKAHLQQKNYKCKEVQLINVKFKIVTDQRTFILLPSEVESFIESVEFIEPGQTNVRTIVVHKAEVIAPEACKTVSEGLMQMFQKISSGEASASDFEQAKSASMIAGKIIDIEKVKLGYLSLNNK